MNYFTPIGEIINQIIPFFKIYTVYVNGYDVALSMIDEEREKKNSDFDKFLIDIENEGTLFQSYLVLPIQRPPRYVLLLKELVKFTPVDHPDYSYLEKSLTTLEEVASSINKKKADSESQFQVKVVMSSLVGSDEDTRKKIQRIGGVPWRRYMFEDEIQCNINDRKKQSYHVFCFNDLLVFTRRSKKKFFI